MSKKTRDDDYGFRDELSDLIDEDRKKHDNQNRNNNDRRDGRNFHDNQNNQNRDNKNHGNQNQGQQNGNNNNNQGGEPKNPVYKILNNSRVFTRDQVLHILVDDDGLSWIVKDLKAAKKNPDKTNAKYVQTLLKDAVFASALIEAVEVVFGKKFKDNGFSKKEIELFMTEIYNSLYNTFDKNDTNYNEDVIKGIRDSYRDILYRYNKKKVKKLVKKVKNMPKDKAKQLVIISSGGNAPSVYRVLKYMYNIADDKEAFDLDEKQILKVFKICYEKENINTVIRWIMLESRISEQNLSKLTESGVDVYATIDMMLREYLNKCDRTVAMDILEKYVADRMRQEGPNPVRPRRFEGKNAVHQDDFPNLIKAIELVERKDFSLIPFLRK